MKPDTDALPNTLAPGLRRHDARLLASLLRTSRVTLLYGDSGTVRSELLRQGVLPLLTRRAGDGLSKAGRRLRAATAPVVERRDAAGSERVVLFDAWSGAPLEGLRAAILACVADELVLQPPAPGLSSVLLELTQRLEVQFLVVLDCFEHLWNSGRPDGAITDFIDQLGEAVKMGGLQANFLLSVDSAAEARLEPLRARIPGFDDATLRLGTERILARPLPAADSAGPAALSPLPVLSVVLPSTTLRAERPRRKRPPRQPRSPAVPINTEGVYAFIESTLTQTADATKPWHEAVDDSNGRMRMLPSRPPRTPGAAAKAKWAATLVTPAPATASVRTPFKSRGRIGRWLDRLLAMWPRVSRKR